MRYIKSAILGAFLLFASALNAQGLIDNDPRRTRMFEQPRLAVFTQILLVYFSDNPRILEEYNNQILRHDHLLKVMESFDIRIGGGNRFQFKFRNPNGYNKAPTEVRFYAIGPNGEDRSFDRFLFGKSTAEEELLKLEQRMLKLPAVKPGE
jgi:hypothetical protein